jgi:DMSO reductase family type II enzyme heme b subunit
MWQEAHSARLKDIRSFYPNTWSDGYLPDFAHPTERAAMQRAFTASEAADNPLAQSQRAVRDLRAEGFGTLEAEYEQSAQGEGVWQKGEWVVTIMRPLARQEAALVPGERTYMAVALWDGSRKDVGSRKMVSTWLPLELEPVR